jgi:multidrug transporter EmrE-like cation transporter
MESSVVYPINHVGTVLFTSLLGILLFKEKLIPKNYIGIAVAIAAIVMIAF